MISVEIMVHRLDRDWTEIGPRLVGGLAPEIELQVSPSAVQVSVTKLLLICDYFTECEDPVFAQARLCQDRAEIVGRAEVGSSSEVGSRFG